MKVILILILLILLSCSSERSSEIQLSPNFFDLKRLIEYNITTLNSENPLVKKTWKRDGTSEEKEVKGVEWNKELKLFLESDLNKSAYISSFDSLKSKEFVHYMLKPGESIPIKELRINFNSNGEPESIKCIKSSQNMFFSIESRINIELNRKIIRSYYISQVQKLLWFKPDSTEVRGTIIR